MYSTIPGILDDLVALMGDRVRQVPKRNKIFLNGFFLEYPLKLTNLLKVTGLGLFLKITSVFAIQKFLNLFLRKPATSYEDFMIQTFGKPTYQLIFQPLAEKVWGKPKSLHPDMARIRVPALNTFHLILRLLKILPENKETNAQYFYYPKKGFGDFAQKLKEEIEKNGGKILTRATVVNIQQKNDLITNVNISLNGTEQNIPCEKLISSIPLGQLLSYLTPNFINDKPLHARHLILVYIFVNKPKVSEEQWVFFPEQKFLFSRLSEQKNMSPDIAPKERTVLCCDFTCEETSEVWSANNKVLIDDCAQQLVAAKFLDLHDIELSECFVIRKPHFYPRYDLDYLDKMGQISEKLKMTKNLLTTGRLGMFNYNNSDHCFDMGKFIAQGLAENKSCRMIWENLEKRVRDYKIVD